MVASGRLDRLISIQTKAAPQSSSGEQQETWSTTVQKLAAVYIPVPRSRGAEVFSVPERVALQYVEFRVRYSSLTSALQANLNRIVYPALEDAELSSDVAQGRVYDIQLVLEIGRREALQLLTQRRADVT